MNFQAMGRYQRARGLKLKRALQFATLLAICIWLLYQIKHPHDKSSPSKFSKQRSILGRKVNMEWWTSRNESDSEGGKIIDKSKSWEHGTGDDPLGKSQEEKANKYLNEISVLADDKDNHRSLGMQHTDLHGGSDGNGDASLKKERRDKDSVNEGYQNLLGSFMHSSPENPHKEGEVDGRKPEIAADTYRQAMIMKRKDVTGEHDLALELEDKNAVFPDRTDNPWQYGIVNGLHGSGFDDENGVPLGLNDVNDTE